MLAVNISFILLLKMKTVMVQETSTLEKPSGVYGNFLLKMKSPNQSTLGMYVCMYVRMFVHMYVCMYACMHACMYVCTYVRTYVCMYVCMYVCSYTYVVANCKYKLAVKFMAMIIARMLL